MSSHVQAASSGGRIALAGATGRIGSALAASLVADPVSVVALTRDPQTARLPDTTAVVAVDLSSRMRPSSAIGMTFVFSVCRLVSRRCHTISAIHRLCLKPSQNRTKGFSLSGSSFNRSASQKGSG